MDYRKVIQKDANSPEAHYRLGLSEWRQQHYSIAWQSLNRAYDLAPQREDIAIQLGNLCIALNAGASRPSNLSSRLAQISRQLLAKDSNSFDGWRFSGYSDWFEKKNDAAIASFKRASQISPSQPDVRVSLARVLFQDGQEQDAESIARAFINSSPSYAATYDLLFDYYMSRGRAQDAERILERKISNNPGEPSYVTQLSDFYFRAGRHTEALELIAKLLDRPKREAETHLAVGDFYLGIGRLEDARRQFDQGLGAAKDKETLFQKRIVHVLLAQGKTTEAAALLDQILNQSQHDREALTIRAGLRVDSQQPQMIAAALSDYQELLNDDYRDPALHYGFARALQAKGDLLSARVEFKEVTKLQPDHLAARLALGEIALKQKKPEDALAWATEALSIDAGNDAARLMKAIALRASGKYDLAGKDLESILRASPQNVAASLQLGLLEIQRGNFRAADTALMPLQAVSGADPSGSAFERYATQADIDEAFDVLKKAVIQSPEHMVIHNVWATLAMYVHQYDRAIAELGTILVNNPNATGIYLRLAEVHRMRGDMNSCISALERAQRSAPGTALPTILLASAFESSGRVDLAVVQYRRALELQPEDPRIVNHLARTIAETDGNLDEALVLARRAVQKTPDQPQFSDTLGWVYFKKNMLDSALKILDGLAKKYPDDPSIQYHLGAALLQKGDKRGSRIALRVALANKPSTQEAEKIRGLLARIE